MQFLGARCLRVTTLSSGSSGNATLFEARGTRVLVDAGVTPRGLERALRACNAGGRPQAIVLTHAHDDHLGWAPLLARKLRIPLYASPSTARALPFGVNVEIRRFSPRDPFQIGALRFHPQPIPHDAANVALVVDDGSRRVGLATDLGEVTPHVRDHLSDVDVLMIESNHDVQMLEGGSYPHFLKRRIRSPRGHLSNVQTHALLQQLSPRTHAVVLLHLSRSNNRPELALETARDAIGAREIALHVAPSVGIKTFDVAPHSARAPAEQLALWHDDCFIDGHAPAVDAHRRQRTRRIAGVSRDFR